MKKQPAAPRPMPGHLSHRSYTGKRLPKQHTSYSILLFLVLCVGVFLAAFTLSAGAADVSVSATSEGPPPPLPALITSPAENDRFSSVPIGVTGTCPARFVVKLYRNDVFSGNALCALDNTFHIQTDLFENGNDLKARVFNAVDDEGPESPAIRVYYDKPPEPVSPVTPVTNTENAAPQIHTPPPVITADTAIKGYYAGEEVVVPLNIAGGTAPYALSIDWGDGNSSIISRKEAGEFSIHHVYAAPGPAQDSYTIKLTVSDVNDNKTSLQLTVLVRLKPGAPVKAVPGSTTSGSDSGLPQFHIPAPVWIAYGVTTLMAISFWLGAHPGLISLNFKRRI